MMHNGRRPARADRHAGPCGASGTVVGAAPNAGYGNWIRIDHAQNVATVYGHLSAFAPGIRAGAKVERGQVIGFVVNTSRSTGPHLHFEVINKGQATDPMTFSRTKRTGKAGGRRPRELPQARPVTSRRRGKDEAAFQLTFGPRLCVAPK